MEDIAAVLVHSFSATVHNRFLIEAAKQRMAVLFCENFKPVSIVLPANRSTDTLLTRAQINASPKLIKALWQKTIDAKCTNQASLAEALLPEARETRLLREEADSKKLHKEAGCAKLFWRVFSQSLEKTDFVRQRNEPGLNHLLNYGYTVLLARCLQKLMAIGLDPTFGIGHLVRERSTPLAYDLLEPFRPIIDARIAHWFRIRENHFLPQSNGKTFNPYEVSRPYKIWVQTALEEPLPYLSSVSLKGSNVIERVFRSFRAALLTERTGLYKPWTQRSSKWAGLS